MKLLFFIYSLGGGGAEKAALNLAQALSHEHEIVFVAMKKRIDYTTNFSIHYISDDNYHASFLTKLFRFPLAIYHFIRFVRSYNPDVIISFLMRPNLIATLSKALLVIKTKILLTEHGVLSSYYNFSSFPYNILKKMIQFCYPRADYVVAVSQTSHEDLIKNFSVQPQKSSVIPNIINLDILSLANESLAHPQSLFRFITIGRLIPTKRIETLLYALSSLQTPYELIVLGEGEEKPRLITLATTLGVNAQFIGFDNNPYKWIKNSDCFVFSSELEALPTVIIEALLLGIPIISSDCISGPREILAPLTPFNYHLSSGYEETPYGVLIAVDDISAFSHMMEKMIHNTHYRQEYQKNSLLRSYDYYPEPILEKYRQILIKLTQ